MRGPIVVFVTPYISSIDNLSLNEAEMGAEAGAEMDRFLYRGIQINRC